MYLITRLVEQMRRHVRRVSWGVVACALLAHLLLSWGLLAMAGEDKLTAPHAFPYYYMTTATTIGYGDLSPATVAGRWIAVLVLMPGAVALFATVLAKTSSVLVAFWRRHMTGRMAYTDWRGHTVLVGWREGESQRLLQLLLSDCATDDEGVVLVAEGLAENPAPEAMRFVATGSYADPDTYLRAGIAGAARVIVNPRDDDQTLAAVFALMAHAPRAHVVAHFDEPGPARLVAHHYPRIECTRPMSAEIIARAAQDPGSAALTAELLSVEQGATQFSLQLPAAEAEFATLASCFEDQQAMLLGWRDGAGTLVLNPPRTAMVPVGASLYYLASRRLLPEQIRWPVAPAGDAVVTASGASA